MKEKGIEKESERETVESVRVRVGSSIWAPPYTGPVACAGTLFD